MGFFGVVGFVGMGNISIHMVPYTYMFPFIPGGA